MDKKKQQSGFQKVVIEMHLKTGQLKQVQLYEQAQTKTYSMTLLKMEIGYFDVSHISTSKTETLYKCGI